MYLCEQPHTYYPRKVHPFPYPFSTLSKAEVLRVACQCEITISKKPVFIVSLTSPLHLPGRPG